MKFSVRFSILALIIAFLFQLTAIAQNSSPGPKRKVQVVEGSGLRFFHIASAKAFSPLTVAGMVQDNQGFIWMSSQYGLYRYDGYQFKVFLNNPDDPKSLGGVYIYSLFKDRGGKLWVGCDHSLDLYDPDTETFSHYLFPAKPIRGESSPIANISQDRTGTMWLATRTGLYRFDPLTGTQKRFTHESQVPDSLSSSDVKAALEDRDGDFWVATKEGIDKFDRSTGKVTLHLDQHEDHEVYLHQDRFGIFWVTRVSGSGLSILDKAAGKLIPISLRQGSHPFNGLIGMTRVLEDNDGTIWIGSSHQGLFRYDRQHRDLVRYQIEPDLPHSNTTNDISSLMEDRDGNIWASLVGWGPSLFPRKKPSFQAIPSLSTSQPGDSFTLIDSLFTDNHSNLWVGTDRALVRYTHINGQLQPHAVKELSSLTRVIAIAQEPSGILWFGTWRKGLTQFDPATGRIKTYRHDANDPSSLSDDAVTGLLVDSGGTLWASTWDGLDRFDARNGRFKKFLPTDGTTPVFWKLAEDRQGIIWIGSVSSGVYSFDPRRETFRLYQSASTSGSLSNDRVNSVFIDHANHVWLATQNGLNMLDRVTGRMNTYYERDGLAGNAVSCILEDHSGTLWMGTNKGISSLNPETRIFRNYTTADGLTGNDMTGWSTCSISSKGEFAFGGFSGGITFRPSELDTEAPSPAVILTDMKIGGHEAQIGGNSPLKKTVTLAEGLTLPHDLNSLSLEFSALNYLSPMDTKYRYKLDGLDKDWTEAGSSQRIVTYTSLPVGTFHFRVEAALQRSNWSRHGVDFRVTILPPWWKTWWFRLIYLGLALSCLVFFYWFRLHEIDRQYRIRFEERLIERVRIARELHDTVLQGFHGLMLRFQVATEAIPPTEGARQVMEDALDRADALLSESRMRIRGLRDETIAELPLSEALILAAEELRLDRAIAYQINLRGDSRKLYPAIQDEVYLVGKEALVNSFTHAQCSRIQIELSYENENFSLRIHDDGRGIPAEVLKDGGKSGHWGIRGMRERGKIIGGLVKVTSAAGNGTEVELKLPARIAYDESTRMAFWNNIRASFSRPPAS